ncbi:F-box protein of unknown function [Saguinus oedipus]|uniref:Uncharacterized protein n=1 Tax=Saguinus oedipus TaxID=9490 RepID=A0ABQ9TFS3_SAGOE|nr:F-box protein of unknown function [Saguinus oedipus]
MTPLKKHVQVAVVHLSEGITQLNLSGCRKNLLKSDVSTLVRRCPNEGLDVYLNLSDNVMVKLKNDCFQIFYQLNYLQHVSLSRCCDIPKTLHELEAIPTLKTLQVFGILPDGTLQQLKEDFPPLQINCSHLTTIARPTIGKKIEPGDMGHQMLTDIAEVQLSMKYLLQDGVSLFFETGKIGRKPNCWSAWLVLFSVSLCLHSKSILRNDLKEKTMCFSEMTLKLLSVLCP